MAWTGLGAAAVLLAAAGPARAALECQYYDDLVAASVMVMQVADTTVTPPDGGGFGDCTLTGVIVQSFLGPHPVGTPIRTSIPCWSPPPPGVVPDIEVGPVLWEDFDALRAAAVVELHISPESGPAGWGAGVVLLDAATDAPAWRSMCE